jgi:hypothetical protein
MKLRLPGFKTSVPHDVRYLRQETTSANFLKRFTYVKSSSLSYAAVTFFVIVRLLFSPITVFVFIMKKKTKQESEQRTLHIQITLTFLLLDALQ